MTLAKSRPRGEMLYPTPALEVLPVPAAARRHPHPALGRASGGRGVPSRGLCLGLRLGCPPAGTGSQQPASCVCLAQGP